MDNVSGNDGENRRKERGREGRKKHKEGEREK